MTNQNKKSELLKTILIIIISISIVLTIGLLSYQKYHNYKINKAIEQTRLDDNVRILAKLKHDSDELQLKTEANKKAKLDTDIKRLVEICTDSQQRYDGLSFKSQIGIIRPDCTISQ